MEPIKYQFQTNLKEVLTAVLRDCRDIYVSAVLKSGEVIKEVDRLCFDGEDFSLLVSAEDKSGAQLSMLVAMPSQSTCGVITGLDESQRCDTEAELK